MFAKLLRLAAILVREFLIQFDGLIECCTLHRCSIAKVSGINFANWCQTLILSAVAVGQGTRQARAGAIEAERADTCCIIRFAVSSQDLKIKNVVSHCAPPF